MQPWVGGLWAVLRSCGRGVGGARPRKGGGAGKGGGPIGGRIEQGPAPTLRADAPSGRSAVRAATARGSVEAGAAILELGEAARSVPVPLRRATGAGGGRGRRGKHGSLAVSSRRSTGSSVPRESAPRRARGWAGWCSPVPPTAAGTDTTKRSPSPSTSERARALGRGRAGGGASAGSRARGPRGAGRERARAVTDGRTDRQTNK